MTPVTAREAIQVPKADLQLLEETEQSRRRTPRVPLLLTALVLLAGIFAVAPLTNAATGASVSGATLRMSIWYLLLAPVCDTLDRLTMLSQGQHFAFLATYALAYFAWRRWRRRTTKPAAPAFWREFALAALALLAVLALYGAGMALPRPMAALSMSSPDAVVADFHSHTRFSWDGRWNFTPEASRRWHRSSGFDVAYVTDHATFAGAQEGMARNPALAGDGTVLLSGIEVRSMGRHLSILGTDPIDSAEYASGDLHEKLFMRSEESGNVTPPVVVLTLPGNFDGARGEVPIDAIEISDGAPRGLAQIDRERARLLGFSASNHIAIVASSNNHGWAGASPAWTVLQIPGWRSMTPAALDTAIRGHILKQGPRAALVVERRLPGPTSSYALAWTVPLGTWQMFASMSWPERLSWLVWIWVSYFAWQFFASRNAARRSAKRRPLQRELAA